MTFTPCAKARRQRGVAISLLPLRSKARQQQSTSNRVRTWLMLAYVWRITCTGGDFGTALVSIVTDEEVRVTSMVLRYWLCGGWDLSRQAFLHASKMHRSFACASSGSQTRNMSMSVAAELAPRVARTLPPATKMPRQSLICFSALNTPPLKAFKRS